MTSARSITGLLRTCLPSLPSLMIAFMAAGPAQADVGACYDLANTFKPSDVNLAYNFVKGHGECIANFEDPAFQAVAGSLTSMTTTGLLAPGQCSAILNDASSPAAQQLLAVADIGVIGTYLNCGCAVADSGIADKIKTLVEDVVSCAKTFDPSGPIFNGLELAGSELGFTKLWGLAGSGHDPRAGVGNGGAPTSNYQLPTCATGKSYPADHQPGGNVQTCECPAPTQLYADNKFLLDGNAFMAETFTCLACPPSQALQNGMCATCQNVQKQNGSDIYGPNSDGTACILMGGTGSVGNPCQANEKWNGQGGANSICCAAWQNPDSSGPVNTCKNICPPGRSFSGGECTACTPDTQLVGNTCEACPSGSHSNFADTCVADVCPPGQGQLPGSNDCGVCPPDTQRKQGGVCEPCQQGSHSDGGDDFCSFSLGGGFSCPAGTVHPPGDNSTCVCAPGTELIDGLCKVPPPALHSIGGGMLRNLPPPAMVCPGDTNVDGTCAQACPGLTVANPKRPGFCMDCPDGTLPDAKHLTCHAPIRLVPSAPQIH